MFCLKCGCQNTSGARFCQKCGAPLNTYAPVQYGIQQNVFSNFGTGNAVLSQVKRICSSPAALVAIIAYTAALLFSFINAISGTSGIHGYIYQIINILDIGYIPNSVYVAIKIVSIIFTLIGMIPTVLVAVGMWMSYTSAANRRYAGMKTSGMTLINAIMIIKLVFVSIALAMIVIASLISLIIVLLDSSSYYYFHFNGDYYRISLMELLAIIAVATVCLAVCFTLLILYYAKAIRTINVIKRAITTGDPSGKVSVYVALGSFFSGVFYILLFVVLIIIIFIAPFHFFITASFYVTAVFFALACMCSAITRFSFEAFIFSYRSKMRSLMMNTEYVPPVPSPVTSYTAPEVYAVPQEQVYKPIQQAANLSGRNQNGSFEPQTTIPPNNIYPNR